MSKREIARGSVWRQWDLHVHTPASFHWTGKKFDGDMSSPENRTLIDEMIEAMNAAEPAVFAIMDYWTFDGWFALKRRLAEPGAPALKKIVFPGIELRLSAPTTKRLNAHVIFAETIPDHHLREFLSDLKLERTDRAVSKESLVDLARGTAEDMLLKKGHKRAAVDSDEKEALMAGYKLAEVKADSYKAAIKKVPDGQAIGFMPFDTSDGLTEVKWEDHYAYFLGLLESSPIFESRNAELRTAFLCEETPKNKAWIGNFKHGLKSIPRLVVSGSDAHCFVGVAGDNDRRGYGDFPSGKKTWIKADLSFHGLKQAILEPAKRSFIGEKPPKLQAVETSKTHFIESIEVTKTSTKTGIGNWLHGCDLPLNPDLVAIIGNKGSGKSALADVIATLGHSRQAKHFSFLKRDRFLGKSGERRMNARVQNAVTGRLSLRPPQAESLAKLVRAIEAAPELLGHDQDVAAILATLKAEFPTLEDFEREFPSLCFSLATGVGKTRLMGAFIAYLHLAHGINNFFVLAPNLTIYNKLIADFTRNTPKYVFKGIAEFAQQPPLIITGDNYDQTGAVVQDQTMGFAHDVRINIFNISKINSEVRGGKEPRIKRMREVLGDSYFNHLASLDDLVLLMDESHRYRASAGVRSINELKPLFGLEVTATPFVESTRGPVPFKNVVMDYPLARAMEDGFVKEPAAVTQRNFDAKAHSAEEIEKIKLEDGVRLHETTKVELLTYARENGVKVVKPFMLVIARDTTHASQLKTLIESSAFYEGRYADKVIQVDSSRTGAEEEEMISKLLAVESVDEPTEIVIHVNMLKEGWDVTNLYTIVPLRAANARTLIEQSIGRGLRLPYGKRTGVAAVDRLNIVAHDKFQEIIDEANRGDSPIRLQRVILEAPSADDKKVSVQVSSGAMARLGLAEPPPVAASTVSAGTAPAATPAPVFTTERERQAARVVMDVIGKYEVKRDLVPTSSALLTPEVQSAIRQQLRSSLPVDSLLDWLHAHHGHLQDATLLRLFHELQHEGSWQIEASEHPETTTLQAIRVLHHPHRVNLPE